jgi:hypothetical protein
LFNDAVAPESEAPGGVFPHKILRQRPTMAVKRIIAIAGAAGARGGGLARAIPRDHGSQFAVRAFTWDTNFLLTSFFWEHFIYFGMGPKRGADGRLACSAAAK